MNQPAIIPGAEPMSVAGGPVGVLVVHGFTGNCNSMRPVANAFAKAGYTVEMPLLPGHGTSVEDMLTTTWTDWYGAAKAAFDDLRGRCEKAFVVGLSMGGSLALALGMDHTDQSDLAGIVVMNPAVQYDEAMAKMVDDMLAVGETVSPGIGSDIAKEGVEEIAYEGTPLMPLKSLLAASSDFTGRVGDITAPMQVHTSDNDHVVQPADSAYLVDQATAPVEHFTYDRSYHVITLDHDADTVIERSLAFVAKLAEI
jgi:carboxylesterase